ncbi:MAG TPA: NAD-dependent protein deacetylase [Longimicrobiales bacterium]|nr:NAD-dependent protein deacetylase [Longimicrobiales bacterium]
MAEVIRNPDNGQWQSAVARLAALLRGRRTVVLAGAGCSTESGIPDYRGTGAARRGAPVQYQEFVRDPLARQRYWARSTVGWPRFSAARPNEGHRALARLEAGTAVAGIITQNVDGLHQAAGSGNVVELHGSLAAVRCLACDSAVSRGEWQEHLLAANHAWAEQVGGVTAETAPDGDAVLHPDRVAEFRVPGCPTCDGIMKPDVVFFGENVPRPRVEEAWGLFDHGEVLLVAGSSLTVFSGRRFMYRACERGVPVVVVNRGPTRADEIAAAKVDGPLGVVLPHLASLLA